ncbi:MarR family winged helix-turn-helix transcriptional regulator [Companilactobacillus alimentarius]
MNTGYLLMQISKEIRYQLNQQLLKENITIQQWAVAEQIHLLSPRKQATVKNIAQALNMDRPTASGIVNRLETKKIITKKVDSADKRSYLISLTSSGEKYLNLGQQISNQVMDSYLNHLSTPEQTELNQLLSKFLKSDEV